MESEARYEANASRVAQMRTVDIAVIGAGTAGLSARDEIAKVTDSYVVIDGGTLGTTCARVGCMPSKALIQVANDFHRRQIFAEQGILGSSGLSLDRAKALTHVRQLRDAFVRGVLESMKDWRRTKFIPKHARFKDLHTLDLGDEKIRADAIVIATGSRPLRPQAWQTFSEHVLDTDLLFEQSTLPDRMAVVGLGPAGAEIGYALARLGIEIVAISLDKAIGGLSDPELQDYAALLASREMETVFAEAEPKGPVETGFAIAAGGRIWEVDKVVLSVGRRPNLAGLGLDQLEIDLDDQGVPMHDPETLRIGDTNIYIAGDASGGRAILHEANDEGRMAGYNAVHSDNHCFRRRVPLAITFTDPQIAVVGRSWRTLRNENIDFVKGTASFDRQGRAVIMREAQGRLHIFADCASGQLLGAELIAPAGEHLAHLLSCIMAQNLGLRDAFMLPFYHPTLEESLRTALHDAMSQMSARPPAIEILRCEGPPAGDKAPTDKQGRQQQ
jgi:dihydrolipoamide dehydrogenase